MNSTRRLWRWTAASALLSTLLLLFGFGWAVRDVVRPQPGTIAVPGEEPGREWMDGAKIQIVALGDSLTKGAGDVTGEGYVGKVKKSLEDAAGKPVYVWNYAVNGLTTDELLAMVQDQGSEIPASVARADIVLLTIGGNDLFRIGLGNAQTATGADDLEIDMDNVRRRMPEALAKLEQIFTVLSELNDRAEIVYVGLYHPLLDYDPEREGSLVINDWNSEAFRRANRFGNITVVPVFDLFQRRLPDYLYTDHFHPNADGYARIAERVLQVLNGSGPG